MVDDGGGDRHSRAASPELITDLTEKAEKEARNALQQFDIAIKLIDDWLLTPERPFKLRPSLIQQLHRIALDGLSAFAGNWRPAGVEILGSKHEPVGAHLVAASVEEMCDYVNEKWNQQTAINLAAYSMWRLNWIHPFDDGNGRTSRMLSYIILCVRSGQHLPGKNTIPEQISQDKTPYYRALDAADDAFRHSRIDVSVLEEMLSGMLANQLVEVYQDATGSNRGLDEGLT
jgi:Fic family protein